MKSPQTILVTGATDGIGLELAKRYVDMGQRVFLLGRKSLAEMAEHPSGLFKEESYLQCDLAEPECGSQTLRLLLDRTEQLDLVIHNAGVGYVGELEEQAAEDLQNLVAVNLLAPIRLSHALLPLLSESEGRLVFVSSILSRLPTPQCAVYSATKSALDGFARSLRVELGGQVSVQLVHPGATRTGMAEKVGLPEKKSRKFEPVENVAQQIVSDIENGRRQSTIGLKNRLFQLAGQSLFSLACLWPGASKGPVPQHVVITGAADGIGRELSLRYLRAGSRVTGIDFDREKASSLEQQVREASLGEIRFLFQDLSHNPEACLDVLEPFDLFIHNAGTNWVGRFGRDQLEAQERVVRVNFIAPLLLMRGLLKRGLLKQKASLVFVSSLSHFVSYPGASVYAASKDGLLSLARSLAWRLKGCRVLTVFPGPTRTEHARKFSPDNSKANKRMNPERLAELIFRAHGRGQVVLLPGAMAKVSALLGSLFPRLGEFAMKKAIFDKLDS